MPSRAAPSRAVPRRAALGAALLRMPNRLRCSPCRAMPRRAWPRPATPRLATPCRTRSGTLANAEPTALQSMPCRAPPRHAGPCRTRSGTLANAEPTALQSMPCRAGPRRATPCLAEPGHTSTDPRLECPIRPRLFRCARTPVADALVLPRVFEDIAQCCFGDLVVPDRDGADGLPACGELRPHADVFARADGGALDEQLEAERARLLLVLGEGFAVLE